MQYKPPPMAHVTAYPDHTVNPEGSDEVTVIPEDGEELTPTAEEIAEWASQYVAGAIAKAYAEHIWTEWNDYEPDGTYSIGQLLHGSLVTWCEHRDITVPQALLQPSTPEPDPKSARVVDRHKCGQEYEVVSLKGGSGTPRRRICDDCPWRVDAKIGAFPAEAFRRSAVTAYDLSDHRFACHTSGKERPQTCVGFLLRGADHNMSVRMSPVDPETLDTGGAELYPSYRAMAEANGVDPNDPALAPCRDD